MASRPLRDARILSDRSLSSSSFAPLSIPTQASVENKKAKSEKIWEKFGAIFKKFFMINELGISEPIFKFLQRFLLNRLPVPKILFLKKVIKINTTGDYALNELTRNMVKLKVRF